MKDLGAGKSINMKKLTLMMLQPAVEAVFVGEQTGMLFAFVIKRMIVRLLQRAHGASDS